jgi:hypothetical protein
MFDIFKGQQDPDSLEIERKLDQDLLEQMLYQFKDEEFYNETKVSSSMAQVDLKNGELVNIDDFYEVLIHIEQTVDMLQFTEYKPSKHVMKIFDRLRKASISAQVTIFALIKKKNRMIRAMGNIDSDVYSTITEFHRSVCTILHEIFESYDIRVYPTFRKKTKENILAFQHQLSKTG